MISEGCFLSLIGVFGFVLIMGGCSAAFNMPAPFDDGYLRDRAVTITENNIRVSAAVPAPEESRAIFGIGLEKKGFQPLWLEIQNNTDRQIYFLPTGLDPEYFSPREVSFGFHGWFSKNTNAQIDEHIESLSLNLLINPYSKSSGFVFTFPDRDSKFISLDLVGRNWAKSFFFVIPNPYYGIEKDHYGSVLKMLKSVKRVEVEDESLLREMLEQLPCCSSTKAGVKGAPLNIILIGEVNDILLAFRRRNYSYTSVAPHYVFERSQDVSIAKLSRWVTAQPHILRVWLTTIRFQGKPVWICQVTTPYGGRFTSAADEDRDITIDPFVDEARNDLIQDLIFSQCLVKMGFVRGMERSNAATPLKLHGGTTYNTDGLRAVLMLDKGPFSISEIEFFMWERLVDHYRKQFEPEEPAK